MIAYWMAPIWPLYDYFERRQEVEDIRNEISSEERLGTLIQIDNEVLQRAERLRKWWVEQNKAT